MYRYWLSYDVGFSNSYDPIYEWLDAAGAKECGDSIGTFKSEKPPEVVTKELTRLDLGKRARLYLLYVNEETHKYLGKFIVGKRRKSPPWTGAASAPDEAEGSAK